MSIPSDQHKRATQKQIEIATIAFILVLALISAVGMWRSGSGARVFSEKEISVTNIKKERDAFGVWKRSGVKGRTVIHFGEHLPVKAIGPEDLKKLAKTADNQRDLGKVGLRNDNYLYGALRSNYIRSIFGVVPDSEWPRIKKLLSGRSLFTVNEKGASTWMDGLPLHSGRLAKLPQFNEPVVLNFSADYFAAKDTSAQAVASQLKKSGIDFDLVTIASPATRKPGYERATAEVKKLRSLLAKDK